MVHTDVSASTQNFDWSNVSSNAGTPIYRIVVSTDSSFNNYNDDEKQCTSSSSCKTDTTSSSSHPGFSLEAERTYYWKVRAGNVNAGGDWSSVRSFTTKTDYDPFPAPSLSSPSNGATDVSASTQNFDWSNVSSNAGTPIYRIVVSTDSSFNNYNDDEKQCTSSSSCKTDTTSSSSHPGFSLEAERTYYWKVRAGNVNAGGDWSSVRSFTAAPPPSLPSAPTNVSASDGTYTNKARITWSTSSGAISYEVYRATSSGGTKSKIGTSSGTSYDDTSASVGTTYYYWVKAKNEWGTSGYSSYDTGFCSDPCPDCSGGTIENFTFKSGSNCECTCSGPLTIGAGVTIESGAKVTFKAPKIKVQKNVQAYEGAEVYMKQQ